MPTPTIVGPQNTERASQHGPTRPCPSWCRHDEPGVSDGAVWHRTDPTVVKAAGGDPVAVYVEQFDEPADGTEPADIQVQICDALVLLDEAQAAALIEALQGKLTELRAIRAAR